MRAGAAGVQAPRAAAKPREGLSLKYIALGAVVALLVAFILSGVVGLVMYQGWLSESFSPLVMSVASFVSLFVGCVYAGRRAKVAGWAHGALTGLLYTTLITITGLAVFDQLAPALILAERVGLGLALGAVAGTVGINIR